MWKETGIHSNSQNLLKRGPRKSRDSARTATQTATVHVLQHKLQHAASDCTTLQHTSPQKSRDRAELYIYNIYMYIIYIIYMYICMRTEQSFRVPVSNICRHALTATHTATRTATATHTATRTATATHTATRTAIQCALRHTTSTSLSAISVLILLLQHTLQHSAH